LARVAPQVGGDKRAHDGDLQAARASVVERSSREAAADAHPLGVGQDLRVDEDDPILARIEVVRDEAEHSLADARLIPPAIEDVDDLDLLDRPGRGRVGHDEILAARTRGASEDASSGRAQLLESRSDLAG